MSQAIASISHIRGESVSWGLRSDVAFAGTETVTCDVKAALNGASVPPSSAAVVVAATVVFVPIAGQVAAYYLFSLTPAQTAAMEPGSYITDAKFVFVGGAVDYPAPLGIVINERVTV